jgi:hypothetical protein
VLVECFDITDMKKQGNKGNVEKKLGRNDRESKEKILN